MMRAAWKMMTDVQVLVCAEDASTRSFDVLSVEGTMVP
jgi:hypothetical protein